MRVTFLCLLILGCLGDVSDLFTQKQTTSASWYDADLVGGGEGRCSLMRTGQVPAMAYVSRMVAMNNYDFRLSMCGMCMEIVPAGTHQGQPITEPQIVMLTDSCPFRTDVCGSEGLYLSNTNSWNGTSEIEWRAVTCPGEIGPLQYYFHHSNQWNIQLQVRNHRIPVSGVTMTMDGHTAALYRNDDNYFVWSSPRNLEFSGGSIQLEISSADGQTINDTIPSAWFDKEHRNIGPIVGKGAQFAPWQGSSADPLAEDDSDLIPQESFYVPASVVDLYEVSQNGTASSVPFPENGCHLDALPADETWIDVAVSPTNYLRGKVCGMCISITDANGMAHVGRVTTQCEECQGGAIRLHDEIPSPVQWRAIPCPCSPPVNITYQAVNSTDRRVNFLVKNAVAPIQAVYLYTLDGRVQAPSSPTDDGTFVYFAPSVEPSSYTPFDEIVKMEVCSVIGECVIDRVNFTQLRTGLTTDGLDGAQLAAVEPGMVARSSPVGFGTPDYRGDYIGALPPPNDFQLYFDGKSVDLVTDNRSLWILLNGTQGQMSHWMTTYKLRATPGNSIRSLGMRIVPGTRLGSIEREIAWTFSPDSFDDSDVAINAFYTSPGVQSAVALGRRPIAPEYVDFTVMMSMNSQEDSVTSSLEWNNHGDIQHLEHQWIHRRGDLADLGVMGFQLTPGTPAPSASWISVSTTVVIRVNFHSDFDLNDGFAWLFFQITGLDRATTAIEVIEPKASPKDHVNSASDIYFTITSTQGVAASKAQLFLVAANGPPGATNNIANASMVDGSVGAKMAGFPEGDKVPDHSDDGLVLAIVLFVIAGVALVCITLIIALVVVYMMRYSAKYSGQSPLDQEPELELDDLYDLDE